MGAPLTTHVWSIVMCVGRRTNALSSPEDSPKHFQPQNTSLRLTAYFMALASPHLPVSPTLTTVPHELPESQS